MGGVYADSFGHYSISQILRKWTYGDSFAGTLVPGVDGRQGLALSNGQLVKTIPHKAAYITGVRFKYNNAPGGHILQYSHVNQGIVTLDVLADGTIAAYVMGTLIGSSTKALHADIYYYIEFKASIAGSGTDHVNATVIVKVDGEQYINGTATAVGGGTTVNDLVLKKATLNGIKLGKAEIVGTTIFNDLYVINTDPPNGSFLGDVIIEPIFANGDVDISFNPAGPHFSRINEVIADDDSSTVYDNNVNDYDLYDWEDIPTFEGTIPFVFMSICARKDKEGLRSLIPIVAGPGVEVGGEQFLNQSYLYYSVAMDTDPAAGGWTVDDFNNQKFGFKIKT